MATGNSSGTAAGEGPVMRQPGGNPSAATVNVCPGFSQVHAGHPRDLSPARPSSHTRPDPGKGVHGPGRGPHSPGYGQAVSRAVPSRRRHAHELATKRPTLDEPSLVNHRLPSGPTVIPKGPLPVPKPLRRLPLVVICPTPWASCSVNQRLPLGPVVMP